LDHHALEDLGPPAGAFDDLEVHAHAVAGLELGDAPQLLALEGVDQSAHGEEQPAKAGCLSRAWEHGSGSWGAPPADAPHVLRRGAGPRPTRLGPAPRGAGSRPAATPRSARG